MKLKHTAFIHNVTVNGSSNTDWGTDIGQGVKHTFTLEGFPDIANAMLYFKISDVENLKIKLGKGTRSPKTFDEYPDNELVLASCFTKIFLNGKELVGQRFIMCIIKETNEKNSKGKINIHKNRCTLKFSNSILYKDIEVNQKCIDAISQAFGLPPEGSWAILEMNIKNEDELHLSGFALDSGPKDYYSVDERNIDFSIRFGLDCSLVEKKKQKLSESMSLKCQDYAYISAIKAKPFLILGGFSGTGKSQKVKQLAFATCPCDGVLDVLDTTPGNYLLISVKPNWHDSTDITGFRSSVAKSYYVTDFMRFLVKAMQYPDVPFFVCLDEMNLAPVEEYLAEFLSVIESRKKDSKGCIVTDPIVANSVFNDSAYSVNFNIFKSLGLELVNPSWTTEDLNSLSRTDHDEAFVRSDIVKELREHGLKMPQNVVVVGTINMDDTTNSFSRKVIDRAMTFETVIGRFTDSYFTRPLKLGYAENPLPGNLFLSDEILSTDIHDDNFILTEEEKQKILEFVNSVNQDLNGTPFKISYRVLNETILLYRAKCYVHQTMSEIGNDTTDFSCDLNSVFDDIIMQKILPRIEGDFDKCYKCLRKLSTRAGVQGWIKSEEKIDFMINQFGEDRSGFTCFWN